MTWVLAAMAVCVGISAAARAVDAQLGTAVFFGMLGPLLAVTGTWLAVARAARVDPASTTGVMMTAFAVKMAFFAAYVVAVVLLAGVERTAFGLSFAAFFVSLYALEAIMLRRLMARVV